MFKQLTLSKIIILTASFGAVLSAIIIPTVLLTTGGDDTQDDFVNKNDTKIKDRNYLVQVIYSNVTAADTEETWVFKNNKFDSDKNPDSNCQLFTVQDLEKNELFKGKNTSISSTTQITKLSDIEVDKFFKLSFKAEQLTEKKIALFVNGVEKISFLIICDLNNKKNIKSLARKDRKLFGKIITQNKDIEINESKPTFTCSIKQISCNIQRIDMTNIFYENEITKQNVYDLTDLEFLTTNNYVFVDLNDYHVLENNNKMDFWYNNHQFTIDFVSEKNFMDNDIIAKINNSIENTKPVKYVKSLKKYWVVKFSAFTKYRDMFLKTNIEQIPNRNDKYTWQFQKNGVLQYNEPTEIYEIKNQDSVAKNDLDSLDKENNLIQKPKYLETIWNKKKNLWLKIVFAHNRGGQTPELFDIRNNGNLVLEGEVATGNTGCLRRIETSTKLESC